MRIETTDGLVGWGEGTLEGHTEAVEGAYQEFRGRFIGSNADNIEDIWQNGYRMGFYRGGPVLMVCLTLLSISDGSVAESPLFATRNDGLQSALSGLDIALWDIKGKKLGVPIWQLLGGKVRDRVRVYGWIGGDKPSDVIDGAKNRKAQGFTAVKMNATGQSDSRALKTKIYSDAIGTNDNRASCLAGLSERVEKRCETRCRSQFSRFGCWNRLSRSTS